MSSEDRIKWNAKYTTASLQPMQPSQVLLELDCILPTNGRALDLAGGSGRNAIWLAQRGLSVTIADISAVGLRLANEQAANARSRDGHDAGKPLDIKMLEIDFDAQPIPLGPWDLILSVCFLDRSLFSKLGETLAPNGLVAIIQPTVRNLEQHAKPPEQFLLSVGEAPKLVEGLEIIHYKEGWQADGRHDAVIVARRS